MSAVQTHERPAPHGRPRQSVVEHLEIINAVVAGDPDRATKAMHAHLVSVIEALKLTPEGQ